MRKVILKNGKIINRGRIYIADILINNDRIAQVGSNISRKEANYIDLDEKWVIPGIIDDQVHFREPGLTHKATIGTESKAAVAGGVTSFMEMPNTKPNAVTQELLQDKYDIAKASSWCNYSFFMGATNDNLEEVLKTDAKNVCGIKVFMGSSTGNMLVDDPATLESLFANTDMLIATHCEDEETIRRNLKNAKQKYGDNIPIPLHPIIRSPEACFLSSSMAVELAKKHEARLHILHISTKDEIALFDNSIPLGEKKITAEACVHHMYFNAEQYENLGTQIKCNPAIKGEQHRKAIFEAMLSDKLDIIATDHAPHTWEEKSGNYMNAPSGLPLVQHSLDIMLDFYKKGQIELEKIVEKMCHAPAICFQLGERGFIDEGCFADIVVINPDVPYTVSKDNIYYKCRWSPLEGKTFASSIEQTWVNGQRIYYKGDFTAAGAGQRLLFNGQTVE